MTPTKAKPRHRTNRERGRRKQQPKFRHVRTEAQRRREQSVKKLRLRGEYINREQGEEGFDFTNAIRQDVRGAAAGGVVRNPDSKPITRPNSAVPTYSVSRFDRQNGTRTTAPEPPQPTGRKLLGAMAPPARTKRISQPIRQLTADRKRVQLPKHLRVPEHEEKRRHPGDPGKARRRRAMVVC